jgi:hypothetical protein
MIDKGNRSTRRKSAPVSTTNPTRPEKLYFTLRYFTSDEDLSLHIITVSA